MYNYVSNKVPLFAGILLTGAGWLQWGDNCGSVPDDIPLIKAGLCAYTDKFPLYCPWVRVEDFPTPPPEGEEIKTTCNPTVRMANYVYPTKNGPTSVTGMSIGNCPRGESVYLWIPAIQTWFPEKGYPDINTCRAYIATVTKGNEKCPEIIIQK
jgi:hypothetical protein